MFEDIILREIACVDALDASTVSQLLPMNYYYVTSQTTETASSSKDIRVSCLVIRYMRQ